MKKIVFLCIAVLAIAGCSNDDDGTIKPTYESIAGIWYPSKMIKADGSIVDYIGYCPSKRDYIEIFNYLQIASYFYSGNCSDINRDNGCKRFYINSDTNEITNCMDYLNGKVTLKKSTLRIDYAKITSNSSSNLYDMKALIFTKE